MHQTIIAMSITKQQAALLFSYDFKLVDKEGKEYKIVCVDKLGLQLIDVNTNDREYSEFTEIGIDFFILAHPNSSLTKEINGVVPIVELAKIEIEPFEIIEVVETKENRFGNIFWVDYLDEDEDIMRFCFCLDSFQKGYVHDSSHYIVKHQPALFDKLYSLHFLPSGIDQSNVKLIKD